MIKKYSETVFKRLATRLNIYSRKSKDVMRCPYCKETLWKRERQVDYEIVIGSTFALVECKQATDRFYPFGDLGFRPIQRQIMTAWMDRGVIPWVFLMMDSSTAKENPPKAWLFTWASWLFAEKAMESAKKVSIPVHGQTGKQSSTINIEFLFAGTELEYNRTYRIPAGHPFRKAYPELQNLKPFPKIEIKEEGNETSDTEEDNTSS